MIVVPTVTPEPDRIWPGAKAPVRELAAVKTVPLMEPTAVAWVGLLAFRPVWMMPAADDWLVADDRSRDAMG